MKLIKKKIPGNQINPNFSRILCPQRLKVTEARKNIERRLKSTPGLWQHSEVLQTIRRRHEFHPKPRGSSSSWMGVPRLCHLSWWAVKPTWLYSKDIYRTVLWNPSGMWCQKSTYSLVLVILWFGIGEIQGGSRQEAGGSSRRCFLLSTKVSRLSVCCNKTWQSIKDPALMHSFTGHPEDLWNLSVFPL